MQRSKWVSLLTAAFVVSLMLSGCKANPQTNTGKEAAGAVDAHSKPPLVIPQSFASTADKLQFAVKAVDDEYFAEAKSLLEDVVATSPDALGYSRLGTARYNLNDFDGAIQAWEMAAQLDEKLLGEMTNNIGNALRDSKKVDEAIKTYRKALEIEPSRWTAAVNLATLLQQQGEISAAVAVLEKTAPLNPQVKPIQQMIENLKKSS